jgi:hypothetical protein
MIGSESPFKLTDRGMNEVSNISATSRIKMNLSKAKSLILFVNKGLINEIMKPEPQNISCQ